MNLDRADNMAQKKEKREWKLGIALKTAVVALCQTGKVAKNKKYIIS